MASLSCTHAIVSRVPLSLRSRGQIELDEARRQHEALVRLLRELNIDVVELPADEAHPEGVFVEDFAVVCNGTALITKPSQPSRQKEVNPVREILKTEMDLSIIEVEDKNATLEGGDVLFTGREFFIGLSKWSNEAGARAVAEAFPEYPCTPIKVIQEPVEGVGPNTLLREHLIWLEKVSDPKRLKSYVTMAGPDVLCVGASEQAQQVLRRMEREATYSYSTLTVPEDAAANCLYINGTLIHRGIEEIPESFKVFCEKVDFARRSVCFSELSKASSGLTSCCLLVKNSRYIKNL